jgi:hypothetical protein
MSSCTSGARRTGERGLPGVAAEDPRSYDLPDFRTLGDGPYPPILLEAFERAGSTVLPQGHSDQIPVDDSVVIGGIGAHP